MIVYRIKVIHASSGREFCSDWCNNGIDLLRSDMTALSENIGSLEFYQITDTVLLPGDFIRQQCYIEFEVKEDNGGKQ